MKWIEAPVIARKEGSDDAYAANCWYRICNKCDGNHCGCNAVNIG